MDSKQSNFKWLILSVIPITACIIAFFGYREQTKVSQADQISKVEKALQKEKIYQAHHTPAQKKAIKKVAPTIEQLVKSKFGKKPSEINYKFNKFDTSLELVDIYFSTKEREKDDFALSRIKRFDDIYNNPDYYVKFPIGFSLRMNDDWKNNEKLADILAAKMDFVINNIYFNLFHKKEDQFEKALLKLNTGLELADFYQPLNQTQAKIFLQNYSELSKANVSTLAEQLLKLKLVTKKFPEPEVKPEEVNANVKELIKIKKFYLRNIAQAPKKWGIVNFDLGQTNLYKVVSKKDGKNDPSGLVVEPLRDFFGIEYKLTKVRKINENLYHGFLTDGEHVVKVEIKPNLTQQVGESTGK